MSIENLFFKKHKLFSFLKIATVFFLNGYGLSITYNSLKGYDVIISKKGKLLFDSHLENLTKKEVEEMIQKVSKFPNLEK